MGRYMRVGGVARSAYMAAAATHRRFQRSRGTNIKGAALGVVFLCTWILQRDPLSLRLSLIVMSYHEEVLAVLILIVMTLGTTHAIGRERNLVQAETI